MKKTLHGLQKVEDAIMIVMFIIMLCSSFAQVVNRNLIGASIGWFDELSRYCMIYMALLATELGLRDNTQMSITAVTDHMKGDVKKVVRIVAKIAVIAFSAILFVNSFQLLQVQLVYGQISPGLGLPMYIPYFALPLTFGITTVIQIALLIAMVRNPSEKIQDKGENKA